MRELHAKHLPKQRGDQAALGVDFFRARQEVLVEHIARLWPRTSASESESGRARASGNKIERLVQGRW